MTTPQSTRRRAANSALSMAGGVTLAAVPAATLAISARTFTVAEQGTVAVAIMAATFAGQVAFAAIVEARLSSVGTERRVAIPIWLMAIAAASAGAVFVAPASMLVIAVTLPVFLAVLEVGRGVSVAERLDLREAWAAVALGAGVLAGFTLAFVGSPLGFVPLAAAVLIATAIRVLGVRHRNSAVHGRVRTWVITDVAVTGSIYPLMNTMILTQLGPAPAALFAAISTVSGLLAIPLNFLRQRLLKEHAPLDIVVSGASVLLGIVAIAVADALGVFAFLFGSIWDDRATILALALACLWRTASILTTLPFAALRRAGRVQILTYLRAAAAVLTLLGTIPAIATQDIAWVFTVLLAGELFQAVLYEVARRWRAA